jgi:hypothetical protein
MKKNGVRGRGWRRETTSLLSRFLMRTFRSHQNMMEVGVESALHPLHLVSWGLVEPFLLCAPGLLSFYFSICDEDNSNSPQRTAWRIKWERMHNSNRMLGSLPGKGATSLFMPVVTSFAESLKTSAMPSISSPRLSVSPALGPVRNHPKRVRQKVMEQDIRCSPLAWVCAHVFICALMGTYTHIYTHTHTHTP